MRGLGGRAMKKWPRLRLAIPAASLLTSTALAQQAPTDRLLPSGELAVATQYVYRGFVQSGGKPNVQGDVHLNSGPFQFGAWMTNIDYGRFPSPANASSEAIARSEVDLYVGIKTYFIGAELSLAASYHWFPSAITSAHSLTPDPLRDPRRLDYVEFKTGLTGRPLTDLTLAANIFFSPSYSAQTGRVSTFELEGSYRVATIGHVKVTPSALIGYQHGGSDRYMALFGNGRESYAYWNTGVTLAITRYSLDIRYWDTSIPNNSSSRLGSTHFCDGLASGGALRCDPRLVATLKIDW